MPLYRPASYRRSPAGFAIGTLEPPYLACGCAGRLERREEAPGIADITVGTVASATGTVSLSGGGWLGVLSGRFGPSVSYVLDTNLAGLTIAPVKAAQATVHLMLPAATPMDRQAPAGTFSLSASDLSLRAANRSGTGAAHRCRRYCGDGARRHSGAADIAAILGGLARCRRGRWNSAICISRGTISRRAATAPLPSTMPCSPSGPSACR